VRRGKENLFEGKVGTLRRFKDDANDVRAGLECGIRVDGFDDYKEGDVIECLEIQKVRASL
jgi:translation initiation factor IF-2